MAHELEQRNYNAIVSLRLAIIFNGMKIIPTPEDAGMLAFKIGATGLDDSMLSDPRTAPWRLYALDEDMLCPIHAVMCPSWLVTGADSLIPGPLNMGAIDPLDWTNGLRETYAKLPTYLIEQQESKDLLNWFLEKVEASPPEQLEEIRKAIKRKAEAIAAGERCIAGESDEETEGDQPEMTPRIFIAVLRTGR